MNTDIAVLCGLAGHPHTTLPLLLRLAAHTDRPLALADTLVRREHLPPPLAEALLSHPDPGVRRRLAVHRSTPLHVLRVLAHDEEAAVRAAVATMGGAGIGYTPTGRHPWDRYQREDLPAEVYAHLAADPVPSVRAEVARNSSVPAEIRAGLAADADTEVRRCAALRALPDETMYRLMRDPERQVRETALMTAAVQSRWARFPADLIDVFADDGRYHRETAASLAALTPELFGRCWARPHLRAGLAANSGLPVDRMRACLADEGLAVALAANPALPAPLLEELAAIASPRVREELLYRPDLPHGLQRQLVEAGDGYELPEIEALLPEHADLAERLSYLDHPHPAYRRTLTRSPDLPVEAVARLAADADFTTRLLTCERHQQVPGAALVDVLGTWTGHSREDLLRHPCLPVETLAGYAAGDNPRDRYAIASRPDVPREVMLRLLADGNVHVRATAAANPALPGDLLQRLLTDDDPVLRQAAASNPVLPAEQLERLAEA